MSVWRFVLVVLAVLAHSVAAFAQDGVDDDARVAERDARVKERDAADAARGVPPVPVEVPPDARMVESGKLRMHLAPIIACDPRRVAPGASGSVSIVLALQQHAILRPGDRFLLSYDRQQGPLTFDQWHLEPAKPGTLPTALAGQPVYENTANVTVPFAVAADATHGAHAVAFVLECDVADQHTGKFILRGTMDIAGQVAVGDPLPTPMPLAPAARAAPAPRVNGEARAIPGDTTRPASRESPSEAPAAVSGVELNPLTEAATGEQGSDAASPPVPAEDGGGTGLLIGGAVVAVLALVLVIARRPL